MTQTFAIQPLSFWQRASLMYLQSFNADPWWHLAAAYLIVLVVVSFVLIRKLKHRSI